MAFFTISSSSTQYLQAPPALSRKRTQQLQRPRDDVDEFLSSDLELSFASTMSLNSPPRDTIALSSDHGRDEPMDISPAPPKILVPAKETGRLGRPRAFTSAARMFGRDMSNGVAPSEPPTSTLKSGSSQSNAKRIQRSALPTEWFAPESMKVSESKTDENMYTPPSPGAGDAMDVDSAPLSVRRDVLGSPPLSAAPTITGFNNLFFETMSPSKTESPVGPQPKKRRSLSPDSVRRVEHDVSSSPAPSSPSQHKLERMSSGPILTNFNKPLLQGLGVPSNLNKRPRRPVFSALVQPSEIKSAYPVLTSETSPIEEQVQSRLPPTRRAFSAMLPPTALDSFSDESSFDGPDMSSPAQAYAKRQQVKTLRRCDGTEDFRPLTGAMAMVKRDLQESPSARFMVAGMPGFGDNEAHGKILPCHRVREDGLMRINAQTLDSLLDGAYNNQIADFHVIDCRFDYEYNGGHIPGAVNINTPIGVEEFLLGKATPRPCVSGDVNRKTIVVFHCEFSAKRAPTFAKHLRSKDRALNNHVYPKIHYPEVYVLEGGYCEYFKQSAMRCQPRGYVTMDDPVHALSRKEDLDQFRKAKFGRTKSYAYGDGALKMSALSHQPKRNTAPTAGATQLFAAANAARTRRGGGLSTLAEDGNSAAHSDDDETDIGDSPCPPPTKNVLSKAKRLSRVPMVRAETLGSSRMAY
ncbi:hypothetical protein SERLADRAFT_363175 [Serpula lacrymans var. lacrymans S7.9]|nr:uncharacterized protein SERLADRAFT_363175 [Serpula lacrymans var. lacrymans S7.9]EGO20996.1 hypothetical protein SERLADRAFT_363175 [Serpula lacrymans var. lacrymans S7.9]